jgi:hypothetical protein
MTAFPALPPEVRSVGVRSPFGVAADMLDPIENPYLHDPVKWAWDKLGVTLWSKQSEICVSVVNERYTAVKSCHDVGKSFVSAVLACWWLDVHPDGEAFVVTTAPSDPQVKAILWREIQKLHRKGSLRGRVTLDAQWKINDELVAYGRKPADHDPAAFSGIHARYVLVIIDEACGVPKDLFDAVDTLATNEHARVLAIGNPDDPASHFAEVCKPGSGWGVIRIDAFESPNFRKSALGPELTVLMADAKIEPSTERVPEELRELLVSPTWVKERIKRWGVGTPLWMSKVRGLFPKVSQDSLIEPGWVLRAQAAELPMDPGDECIGVDVARFGTSFTIIAFRSGRQVRIVHTAAKQDTMETVGHVVYVAEEHRDIDAGPPVLNVDDSGVGGGVTDRLGELGYDVAPLNGGHAAVSNKFFNARSEWYWTLREMFMLGEVDIDPEDDDLANQLQNIKYKLTSRGQIAVETKEEMAKRKVPSPDRADGVCYACVSVGGFEVDVAAHGSKTLTGDLLTKGW